MKKILSTILTTVMLATPMVTANCFADEPKLVSESLCENSTCCDSNSSKASKMIAIVGAVTAGLVSTVLLTEFAPNGELGLHVKNGFNAISDAVVPYFTQAKDKFFSYCLKTEGDSCTRSIGSVFEDVKENLTNWSNMAIDPVKNFWETNSVIAYLAKVGNAVANNLNPSVER